MGNLLDPNRTHEAFCRKTKGFTLFIPLPKTFWSPFWMEKQRHGKKNVRLVGKPLPLRSPPFHLFLFLSARSLGSLFRQRGSDRTLSRSDAGQKSWHVCHGAWIKHGPPFSGGLCLLQHSKGQNLFFFRRVVRYFPVSLSKIVLFFFFVWYIQLLQHQYRCVY